MYGLGPQMENEQWFASLAGVPVHPYFEDPAT
jgi:hypothetical protein